MKKNFYFRTFARIAVVSYVGGAFAHTLRLIFRFPLVEAPAWIHWPIIFTAGYASFGFVLFIRNVKLTGVVDKILYGVVMFHLGGSAILHIYSLVANNSWMGVFPLEFSYFALFYFVGLGFYCRNLSKRIDRQY